MHVWGHTACKVQRQQRRWLLTAWWRCSVLVRMLMLVLLLLVLLMLVLVQMRSRWHASAIRWHATDACRLAAILVLCKELQQCRLVESTSWRRR